AAVSVSGPIERLTRKPGLKFGDTVADAARRVEQTAAAFA
ncbi:MAG: IclR family transcriptional regulator, partial [Microthrixaceae bacterium]